MVDVFTAGIVGLQSIAVWQVCLFVDDCSATAGPVSTLPVEKIVLAVLKATDSEVEID